MACSPAAKNAGSTTGGSSGGSGTTGGTSADTFAWVESLATSPNASHITAAASDATGVVIVGQITGSATVGTQTLTATSTEGNAFVAKLDPNGNVLWGQIASGDQSLFEGVTLDANSNVFITGVDYGNGAGGFVIESHPVNPNLAGSIGGDSVVAGGGVVVALDKDGNYRWASLIEITTAIDAATIAVSGTNVIVAGALDGGAALAPGEVSPITTCSTDGCVFLASFDATLGAPGFLHIADSTPARNVAGADDATIWAASDSSGNIVLAIGAGSAVVTHPSDANQIVINKYDPTGTLIWAKAAPMPASGGPDLNGLAVDASGNAYIVGDNGNRYGQGAG